MSLRCGMDPTCLGARLGCSPQEIELNVVEHRTLDQYATCYLGAREHVQSGGLLLEACQVVVPQRSPLSRGGSETCRMSHARSSPLYNRRTCTPDAPRTPWYDVGCTCIPCTAREPQISLREKETGLRGSSYLSTLYCLQRLRLAQTSSGPKTSAAPTPSPVMTEATAHSSKALYYAAASRTTLGGNAQHKGQASECE